MPRRFLPLGSHSLADPSVTAALRVILLGNARLRQADELGERCIRPAGPARQGRDQAGNRCGGVSVECAQLGQLTFLLSTSF
jgi:hypothetical protein